MELCRLLTALELKGSRVLDTRAATERARNRRVRNVLRRVALALLHVNFLFRKNKAGAGMLVLRYFLFAYKMLLKSRGWVCFWEMLNMNGCLILFSTHFLKVSN